MPDSALGAGFDAYVSPGARSMRSGGWYDTFAVAGGRVIVAVGDAAGRPGATALPERLRARFAPGAAAPDTRTLLRAVESLVREQHAAFTGTALVAVVDRVARTAAYISRGDTAPCLRYRDGTVALLPADRRMTDIDVREHPAALTTLDLRGVDLLLLHSGASRAHSVPGASDALATALADPALPRCRWPAAWLSRTALARAGGAAVGVLFENADDWIAGTHVPGWHVAWSFDAAAESSRSVRLAFIARLAAERRGGVTIDVTLAELIFGELLGNVVRHAPGRVDIALDWTAERPVLHIRDNGPGFASRRRRERLPADDLSESGRGLFIVNACAAAFSIRARRSGGTHAAATLPLAAG